jgi:hypothetical protein
MRLDEELREQEEAEEAEEAGAVQEVSSSGSERDLVSDGDEGSDTDGYRPLWQQNM